MDLPFKVNPLNSITLIITHQKKSPRVTPHICHVASILQVHCKRCSPDQYCSPIVKWPGLRFKWPLCVQWLCSFYLFLVQPLPRSLSHPLLSSPTTLVNHNTDSSITSTWICSQGRGNVDTEVLLAQGDGNNESRAYSHSPPPPCPPITPPSRAGLERPGGKCKTLIMA